MGVPMKQTVITATVSANSTKDIASDEIRYGPIGFVGIYVYADKDAEWELRIGGLTVARGKCFTTKFDGDLNKLQPIMLGADPGELVELLVKNNDTANDTSVEATIYYIR